MSARTRPNRRTIALAVALCAAGVLLLVSTCGGTPPTAPPPAPHGPVGTTVDTPGVAAAVTPPVEVGFDYADPTEVCRRFVAALYSADTTRDAGPGVAYSRAAQYLSGALAGQSAAAVHDGRWETWSAHHARLEVQLSVHPDMHPDPDTTITAARAYRLAATAVGTDGWRGWTEHSLVYCDLERDPGEGRWRVAAYNIYPVQPR